MKIGILAAQGAFAEHINMLARLGVETVAVRLPEQMENIDGLIIPGGESTTISKLMDVYKLADKIKTLAEKGLPIFGTCAGMILMANEIPDHSVEPLGLMDISVRRNAFGRQTDSFEVDLPVPALGEKPFPCVFIRAPLIEELRDGVEVLARLPDRTCVAVKQGRLLALAFHPELTSDLRFHRYFADLVAGKKN
ncbi:MAG: pyridoxal 5'-phosphate synthase glutaminase subunit PdxT [Chloroflexota bacterium]